MPPDFSQETITLLGQRSSLLCNNPECMTVTVGPEDANGPLKLKLGEAAHICAARELNGARFDRNMTDDQRAHFDNGIWLCASCHTMVDKNDGVGFPKEELLKWKHSHERLIRELLLSHRSPMPILRKLTKEGKYAQDFVDLLEQHGAFFVEMDYEIGPYVERSLDHVRKQTATILKQVRYDENLRSTLKEAADAMRSYMNETGPFTEHRKNRLLALRDKVGVVLKRLRDQRGCRIGGQLARIVP